MLEDAHGGTIPAYMWASGSAGKASMSKSSFSMVRSKGDHKMLVCVYSWGGGMDMGNVKRTG